MILVYDVTLILLCVTFFALTLRLRNTRPLQLGISQQADPDSRNICCKTKR